jgi:YggT family protein
MRVRQNQPLSLIFYFAYITRDKSGIFKPFFHKNGAITPHHELGLSMYAVIALIDQIINIYIWTLLIYIGVGWLVAFRIINPWQPAVRMITDLLARIHEPLLGQVRRFLPDLGPVDISPIVLFLAAQFIRNLLISSLSG